MRVVDVESLNFQAPEVVAFTVDEVPDTHEEWAETIAGLDFPRLIGSVATYQEVASHPTSYTMIRQPEAGKTRDWWAGDHLLHVDGTRWDRQPDMTVIGCKQVEEGAPGTVLLDTAELYLTSVEDGFWGRWGFDQDDLDELSSIFADSTYHREALPYLKNFMNQEEKAVVAEILEEGLKIAGCETVEELLSSIDNQHPAKEFDLVRSTPFSGLAAVFVDGGVRNSKILGPDGEDLTGILHEFRRQYLSDGIPEELGIAKTITWEPNKCVMFPQVGTLHQAQPGNQHNRELHLGFLNLVCPVID